MAPFPVDPSGGDGRGCARLGAGGTPALPGSRHPMTSSLQGHHIAEALWRRLWLKEVHLFFLPVYLCLFVSICGSSSLTISRFSSNDPHGRAGARLAGKREFPKGCSVGFLRSRPPDTPHRTAGTASPGSAGVPPASCSLSVPLAGAELQCDAAGSHPVGGNPIGQAEGEPWRRSRLIQVGEMAEAVPGLVRAGRPRSREAVIP